MLGPEPTIGALDEEIPDEEGLPEPGEAVLYVSAEESVEQVVCSAASSAYDSYNSPMYCVPAG